MALSAAHAMDSLEAIEAIESAAWSSCPAEQSRDATLPMEEIRGASCPAYPHALFGGVVYAAGCLTVLRVTGVDPIAISERTAARRAR